MKTVNLMGSVVQAITVTIVFLLSRWDTQRLKQMKQLAAKIMKLWKAVKALHLRPSIALRHSNWNLWAFESTQPWSGCLISPVDPYACDTLGRRCWGPDLSPWHLGHNLVNSPGHHSPGHNHSHCSSRHHRPGGSRNRHNRRSTHHSSHHNRRHNRRSRSRRSHNHSRPNLGILGNRPGSPGNRPGNRPGNHLGNRPGNRLGNLDSCPGSPGSYLGNRHSNLRTFHILQQAHTAKFSWRVGRWNCAAKRCENMRGKKVFNVRFFSVLNMSLSSMGWSGLMGHLLHHLLLHHHPGPHISALSSVSPCHDQDWIGVHLTGPRDCGFICPIQLPEFIAMAFSSAGANTARGSLLQSVKRTLFRILIWSKAV